MNRNDLQSKYNAEGGPAFPHQSPVESWGDPSRGMTLRDAFALSALAAIISKAPFEDNLYLDIIKSKTASIAVGAYCYADAMLKARGES